MCSNVELYANFVCELSQSSFAILFEKAESGQDFVYLALLLLYILNCLIPTNSNLP